MFRSVNYILFLMDIFLYGSKHFFLDYCENRNNCSLFSFFDIMMLLWNPLSFFPLNPISYWCSANGPSVRRKRYYVFIAGRPKAALLFCRFLAVLFFHCSFHCYCVRLAGNSSIVAACPSIQLPSLLFVCILFVLFIVVRSCFFSGEPKQN